jgi:DNA-binding NarL/FixJ family response regulator
MACPSQRDVRLISEAASPHLEWPELLISRLDKPVDEVTGARRPPSLLLLEPHALYRAALRSLLESALVRATVEPASSLDECAELLARSPFDLVVAAITPELSPRRVVGVVAQARPGLPLLFLAESSDVQGRIEALRAGATGTLTRDSTPEDFVAAIEASVRGRRSMDEQLADHLLATMSSIDRSLDQAVLSKTEREILGLIGGAWSTRAIADAKGISQKSVRNHVTRIYRKVGVRSRPEAVRYAARMGIGVGAEDAVRP